MKLHKFLIVILTFLLLTAIMVSPIYAAVATDSLTIEQKKIVINNTTASGLSYNMPVVNGVTYFQTNEYTDSATGQLYVARGNHNTYDKIVKVNDPTFNISLFLSGVDTVTVQFFIAQNKQNNTSYYPVVGSVQCVLGSVATAVDFENIGIVHLASVNIPGSSTKTSYWGYLYQATVHGNIDYLRVNCSSFQYSQIAYFQLGLGDVSVTGSSSALQNIDYQVSQIGTKVDTLTSAVQNAASNIGSIVDGQGDILTSTQDIKDFVSSIDSKQDIIIYATENDQLIIQEYNERLTEIKNDFDEYNTILDQYYNPPDVNNVTNIIDQGIPNEYNPQVISPVLTAVFDNSIVTTILIAVGALMLMSYILFGKKG